MSFISSFPTKCCQYFAQLVTENKIVSWTGMFEIKILEIGKGIIATLQYHMPSHGEIIIASYGEILNKLYSISSTGCCLSQPYLGILLA